MKKRAALPGFTASRIPQPIHMKVPEEKRAALQGQPSHVSLMVSLYMIY